MSGGKFEINDKKSLWDGANLHELYSKHTPWEWHKVILERAEEKGLITSALHLTKPVDFLEN